MEVRARYTLMGLFAVAVIFFVFAFVYWLDAAGGLGRRSAYVIRFDGPVAGLLKGSAVLFNGVRVGEVANLKLDAAKPREVLVEIDIDQSTPVRADTAVGIDFQGIAGAPVIALVGGTSTLPQLKASGSEKPVLVAQKNAGMGMTQMARQVLQRFDAILAENAVPVRDTIANINTFSAALARNSDKVDGIVAGLARLTGGSTKKQSLVFDVSPAKPETKPQKVPTGQLLIIEPTALALLDAEKIRIGGPDADKLGLEGARWPDILSKVLQTRIIQSFENFGYMGAVGRSMEEIKTNFRLQTNVRAFEIETGPSSVAKVEIGVKIVDQEGRVVGTKIFRDTQPISELEAAPAMAALNKSSQKVLGELINWVCATI